jgi:acetylornithine deacetylase/succinyl-diaminopimelate desuccinylase-like protein
MPVFAQSPIQFAVALALVLVATLHPGGATVLAAPPTAAVIDQAARASLREFVDLLAIPNDATVSEDIQRNVDWLDAAFRRRGFATQRFPNDGKPMLFAEYRGGDPRSSTLLFYMHLDGQPVMPEQWSQASPWTAVLKQRVASGAWEPIPMDRLEDQQLDREWRLFARSASDDKGPIMMLLAALDALAAGGSEPAFTIKVLLDSEEEKGSPSIAAAVQALHDQLQADAMIVNDGPKHASEQPTIIFGNRGLADVTLIVYGPKMNLHSGHYGNYAPNPAFRLAALLASMKGDDGRVTVPGYYDTVVLSDGERRVLAAVPDDEVAIRQRLGIANAERVGGNLQESVQYPSLNVRGMAAAAVGDKVATIVPSHARAELDLRTTPEAPPGYLFDLIRKHIVDQGYHLVDGEPTDAERAQYDKLATLTLNRATRAAYTPLDSSIGAWASAVLEKIFDSPPVVIRLMGGTVPTDKLVDALGMPFVIIPLVNGDNNQHSFDENLRLGHYLDGVKTFVGLLQTPYGS